MRELPSNVPSLDMLNLFSSGFISLTLKSPISLKSTFKYFKTSSIPSVFTCFLQVQQLVLLCCTVNVAEVFSLLLLSIVPSIEDFALHKLAFGSFLFFSAVYVATSYRLFSACRTTPLTQNDRLSLRYKKRLLITNFSRWLKEYIEENTIFFLSSA